MKVRKKALGLFAIILFALFGCSRAEIKAETSAESAAYETDDERILSLQAEAEEEEKLEYDLIPMVKVNGGLYYSTNDTAVFPDNFADGQIISSVDSSEIPVQNDQSNFGKAFDYRYGLNREELYVNINGIWERFESRRLTLDQVLTLSEKKSLTWSQLSRYEHTDIGSGLMILSYDIDPEFRLIVGGTGAEDIQYIRLASAEDINDYMDIGTETVQTEEIKQFIQSHKMPEEIIGISACIKELYQNSMLIHSDSDDFPGVFLVDNVDQAIETDQLKEGMSIELLMQNTNRMDYRNHTALYHAEKIVILTEDTLRGEYDILLTDIPMFSLSDALSSQYNNFSVPPRNYTFTAEENGEEKTITACGAAPLEPLKEIPTLTLPNYNMEDIVYLYSTQVSPDQLTIRQWDGTDIGNMDARPERITTYYYQNFLLELKRGKLYEFQTEWKKENMQNNKFYASASYVLATE